MKSHKVTFTIQLSLALICFVIIIINLPKKRSYTITTKGKFELNEKKTVKHTVTNDSLIDLEAPKCLFDRSTKEMFDANGNLMFIADTFYVDKNNRIIKIIETLK
jgi:hypothetical protein